MSLPELNNFNTPITTFTTALKHPDAKREIRIKLKRRTSTAGGVDSYDASWTTITGYWIDEAISDITWGIDDQEWIQGVTRNSSVDLVFTNSRGKFNFRTDPQSLWYDANTSYYPENSLLEIDFGFTIPLGIETSTTYWNPTATFSGLIKHSTFKYTNDSKVQLMAVSKLDRLLQFYVHDIWQPPLFTTFELISMNDLLIHHVLDNTNSALELTLTANSPRQTFFFSGLQGANPTVYKYFESVAKQTGGIFGINRRNEIFLTYFGNTNIVSTTTNLSVDTGTTFALHDFTQLASEYGNENFQIYSWASATSGKFGSGYKAKYLQSIIAKEFTSFTIEGIARGVIGTSKRPDVASMLIHLAVAAWTPTAVGLSYSYPIIYSGTTTSEAIGNFGVSEYNWTDNDLQSKKEIYHGDNCWVYYAFASNVNDNIMRFFINGYLISEFSIPVASETTINAVVLGNLGGFFTTTTSPDLRVEYDQLRYSNIALSAGAILTNALKIFGSKATFESTSSYDFYNYGYNENIFELIDYNDGINKIFNVINISRDLQVKYSCEFTFYSATAASGQEIRFYEKQSATDYSVYTATVLNNALGIFNFANTNLTNIVSSYEHPNKVEFYFTDSNLLDYSNIYIDSIPHTATFAHLSRSDVTTSWYTFKPKLTFADLVYQNTASVIEYGIREYPLELPFENISASATAALATSILDTTIQQKARLQISTRFLESDPDLFDRVTVHWRPDFVHEDELTKYYETDTSERIVLAHNTGAITWDTKEFYIIGINHSWSDNKSTLSLREV